MKIRCSQCNARFHYESNSGICPRCMEYNPWTQKGPVPGYSRSRRFVLWGLGFMAASALVLSPFIYQGQKDRYARRESYQRELEGEAQGELTQQVSRGEPVRAGEHYITPGTAFWLPEIDTVGVTDKGGRILAVPVEIAANEEDPKERNVYFGLGSEGEEVESYLISYKGDTYWPEMSGRFLDDGYMWNPDHGEQYMIFETAEKVPIDELWVEEGIREPDSYEMVTTRIYKTPISIAEEETGAEGMTGEFGLPGTVVAEPGNFFDYMGSRLCVEAVRCEREAGDYPVPEGKKIVAVTLRRQTELWPNSLDITPYTVLTDSRGTISPNLTDWDLSRWLDTDLDDLQGYYYEYNYRLESDSNKEDEQENPETVYQCYLVDEGAASVEMVFPVIAEEDEDGPGGSGEGCWQIRVPVEIPDAGNTVTYEQGENLEEGGEGL